MPKVIEHDQRLLMQLLRGPYDRHQQRLNLQAGDREYYRHCSNLHTWVQLLQNTPETESQGSLVFDRHLID